MKADLRARKAAEKRFAKYQRILQDYEKRYGLILSMVDKQIEAKMIKCKNKTIKHLAGMVWYMLALERQSIFSGIMQNDFKTVTEHQCGYYATLRLSMEMVADLEYLASHPKELASFFTDPDKIKEEMIKIQNSKISSLEKDQKLAALTLKGKINSRITDRVSEAFPGYLQDYATFCMYTHLSMQGMRLFSCPDAIDLLLDKTMLITIVTARTIFMILDALQMIDEESEMLFRNVHGLMSECYSMVNAVYFAKLGPQHDFAKGVMKQHEEFCHRKQTN